MFKNLHLDIYPLIFAYLPQKKLLDLLRINNRTFYKQIMKYVAAKLLKVQYEKDAKYCCELNLIISFKLAYAQNKLNLDNFQNSQYLYWACKGGHTTLVNFIIRRTKNINIINHALGGACESGNIKVVKLVLKYGACSWWDNALFGACKSGNMKIVKLMIENGANKWNFALRGACEGGNLDIIELLIKKGANDWETGFRGACESGNIQLAQFMIQKDVKRFTKDHCEDGLYIACRSGNMQFAKFMIEKGANEWNDGLYTACQHGYPAIVELMINKGAKYCQWCKKSMDEHLKYTKNDGK